MFSKKQNKEKEKQKGKTKKHPAGETAVVSPVNVPTPLQMYLQRPSIWMFTLPTVSMDPESSDWTNNNEDIGSGGSSSRGGGGEGLHIS